ncbi:hypothetical protein PIB30_024170 [Stylosanthes scabra]|uniref:Uncharacterized protein n=1 Tax=Stylosanthes scabra TaxID=79078 RepID=A0ABU6YA45_9FABA|nr:hypothetical protein [Stylosanthes scabra]
MPDDYSIWNEVVSKGKRGAVIGLGSLGVHLSSKLGSKTCSIASEEDINIEQELNMWKEKAKEQEIINKEQKVKLDGVKHKLKKQGRQLKAQQKRIGSTEETLHALFEQLNLPLPSTLSTSLEDEVGGGFSEDNVVNN